MITDFLSTASHLAHAREWDRFDKFLSLTETMLSIPGLDKVVRDEAEVLADATKTLSPQ